MTRIFLAIIVLFMTIFPYTQAGYNADEVGDYDKAYINERFGGDIHGDLQLFPDSLESCDPVKFNVHLLTDLFDTDGHVILVCRYDEAQFRAEIERLSSAQSTLDYKGEVLTRKVIYDEEMYRLPAFIAIDGYDSEYEYALINESEREIVYVYLSYPSVTEAAYHDYLKWDLTEYAKNDTLNSYSMYSFYFEDGKYWAEPGDFS